MLDKNTQNNDYFKLNLIFFNSIELKIMVGLGTHYTSLKEGKRKRSIKNMNKHNYLQNPQFLTAVLPTDMNKYSHNKTRANKTNSIRQTTIKLVHCFLEVFIISNYISQY